MTTDQIKRAVWTLEWQAYGKDRGDADYWVSKWPELEARGIEIGVPDYAQRRVLGWQAGGADAPIYGEYASPPRPYFAPVPPYPNDPPVPDPGPSVPDLGARFDVLETKLAQQTAAIVAVMTEVVNVQRAISDVRAQLTLVQGQLAKIDEPVYPAYVGKFSVAKEMRFVPELKK